MAEAHPLQAGDSSQVREARLQRYLQRKQQREEELAALEPPLPSEQLLLPGPRFNRDNFTVGGVPIRIAEVPNVADSTAFVAWDGAFVLSKYLEARAAELLPERLRLLELGAGTGLVSVAAAALSPVTVVATDLALAVDNLNSTVALNAPVLRGSVTAAALDWFDAPPLHVTSGNAAGAIDIGASAATAVTGSPRAPAFVADLILAADVVWVDSLIPPLVRTLSWLFSLPPTGSRGGGYPRTALIAHQTRSTAGDALFLSLLSEAGFTVSRVPEAELHPQYRDPRIFILRLTRG